VRSHSLTTLASAVAFLHGTVAAAQIVVVEQDRRASASTFVSSDGDIDQEQIFESAPDDGQFDVSVFADASLPEGTASASASQLSALHDTYLRAEGSAAGVSEVFTENATGYAVPQSNFAVRFVLTEASAFSLFGFLESEGPASATVELRRDAQTVVLHRAEGERIDVSDEAWLEADTYDLWITTSCVGITFEPDGPHPASLAFDLVFALEQSTAAPRPGSTAPRAFPNPFRESTRLSVPDGTHAVRVVDARGRLVRTIATGGTVRFDGRDDAGRPLPGGVYWAVPVGTPDGRPFKLVRLW